MRIGVVSDIHANSLALSAALAALRREAVEEIVVLGDLLTYGCHVKETVALLRDLAASTKATFLLGNHDQLYVEMQRNVKGYYDGLVPWIQETASWTLAELGDAGLEALFPWQDEHIVGRVLFSHANPFGARDWSYLSNEPALARASEHLSARGLAAGVFGHTHRSMSVQRGDVWIFNPGSVGQPRDQRRKSTAAVIDVEQLEWKTFDLDYDERAHCEAIASSSMSDSTKRELLKFHTQGLGEW